MREGEAIQLIDRLSLALERRGHASPRDLTRLTGGATMESWRFSAGGQSFVLRRAPSPEVMEGRALTHAAEARIIAAAHEAEVLAPEVAFVLEPEDGLGSGFVMHALDGTSDPRVLLEVADPGALLAQCAEQLARIHALGESDVPGEVPAFALIPALDELEERFRLAGGDRPIIALALRWLREHAFPIENPVLIHGDFRMGNILAEDSQLTGVLDWELAHLGDHHEDLAYACMAVWRFHRVERGAMGLGSIDSFLDAYREAGGRPIDRARFDYWRIYRTCWWALGCLSMGRTWREGADRTLERAVISRRTSEQEIDLLLLLESDHPDAASENVDGPMPTFDEALGEVDIAELAIAVAEWLGEAKERMEGHDRFQNAVARNALGIIARDWREMGSLSRDSLLAEALLSGERTLSEPGLLARLRRHALTKGAVDAPKYPSLRRARQLWIGDD